MRLAFEVSIPDVLQGKVELSDPYQNYDVRGKPSSFGIDLDFPEMGLSKTVKSKDYHLLRGKIQDIPHDAQGGGARLNPHLPFHYF